MEDRTSAGLRVDAIDLTDWAACLLEAAGTPSRSASRVAHSLVESDLRGYDSHGVLRLPDYLAAIRDNTLDPTAEPRLLAGERATFTVDGANAFGQLTASFVATELAHRARDWGVAFGGTRRCRHVGRLGEYVEQLAADGFVAFATVSAEPLVAAGPGGARALGTNPHAWAFPAGATQPSVVVDLATSVVSAGRVFTAQARGRTLDKGQIVDREGRPSQDPADLLDGGALLPFGGHKGFALGLVADLLAGVLTGTGSAGVAGTHGLAMFAIDIAAFRDLASFRADVEDVRTRIAKSGPEIGRSFRLPGEGSSLRRTDGRRDGILLPVKTVRKLNDCAHALGMSGPV